MKLLRPVYNQSPIMRKLSKVKYRNIVPEIGVTLVEGSKAKTGGNDYFKQFGKASKYDYEKLKVWIII